MTQVLQEEVVAAAEIQAVPEAILITVHPEVVGIAATADLVLIQDHHPEAAVQVRALHHQAGHHQVEEAEAPREVVARN